MSSSTQRPLLVVGAGITGLTAALEAAETGREVILVERDPSIGGRVSRIHNYFPKLCPPACGLEINVKRLERNPRVRVMVDAQVAGASVSAEGWSVKVRMAPAHVNERCTACGECSRVCPATVPDPHNLGMNQAAAIRLYRDGAWPRRYVMTRSACPEGCRKCVQACRFDAIDLEAESREETLQVGAVVLATGWRPYPLEKLPELGGGRIRDVIANVNLERLASRSGPTQGKILKPSDGQPPRKVAFVQCAGSRDVNHLPYCSAVCCLASLKQATYLREQLPETEVTIFYIDRRAPGRNEDFLTRVAAMEGIKLIKGKVGKIETGQGELVLRVEDVDSGKMLEARADLVVLATGMVPNLKESGFPAGLTRDEDGFGLDDARAGLFVAGVARRPEDVAASVRDATGAAAKASLAATRSG